MNLLFRKSFMKKCLEGFAVISLMLLGITVFNGGMPVEAAEKQPEVCPAPESAIRFTDKFLDVHMTESGKVWAVFILTISAKAGNSFPVPRPNLFFPYFS